MAQHFKKFRYEHRVIFKVIFNLLIFGHFLTLCMRGLTVLIPYIWHVLLAGCYFYLQLP